MKHELEAKLKIAMRDMDLTNKCNGTTRVTIGLTMPTPPMFCEWHAHQAPSYLQGRGDWLGRIDALTIHFYSGRWNVQADLTLALSDEEPDGFWDRWDTDKVQGWGAA